MKRGPYQGSTNWKLSQIPLSEIEEAFKTSTSILQVIQKLGLNDMNGSTYPALKTWVENNGIDTAHFHGQKWRKGKKDIIDINAVLTLKQKKSSTGRTRRALLASGKKYICDICGMGPAWNGQELVLELDHINGNRRDDRALNLRFLCPNCHSQTPTFRGRNIGKYEGRMG